MRSHRKASWASAIQFSQNNEERLREETTKSHVLQQRNCGKSVKIVYKTVNKIHQAREPRSDRIKIGAIFVGWPGIAGSNAPSEPRPQGLLSK